MSALTLTAAPVDRPRQTRWLLRLHRPAIYTWAVLWLALVALLLALDGPLLNAAADAWRQYESCTTSERCSYDQNAILRYKDYYNYATIALNVLPFVLAAWAGAALTGRELESGTARLAWTQATSPAHWLAVRLAVPALGVTVCTGLLAWLHHRAWTASQGRIESAKEWYDRFTFHAGGPTLAAMALAGLAAGALAGLLLRRTLPALAVGLVAVGVVRWLTELAMPHLWPAVTRLSTVDQGFLGKGMVVDQGMVTASGAHVPPPTCDSVASCATVFDRFTGRYNTYQPQSHLWGVQLTTTALTLAVAALLVTGCFLVLRRQTGTLRAARA
ncbi:ABC transporter permease [Streptomyces griseofuscus]|uniref:ABC transporter permease n=1 Tax=Streptomyces griseofuscus TaxID=146922 RepID=A0A3R8RI13_9ACTN|nr:ABC transporter permease [Streptomyces griseofuscus]RRQ83519.1 ABC transporter permease [Streptomyces griseofuscus]